eukprot:TRINITY_DN11937_c0_g2_i2.p1 TRINITY_DN11937_c0_g2~~TRINITY_DN11937_c0_g2_i2.p1  ORF type:complete len:502 (+),score=29.32 TRINITY_DN11937_c0_g2_i2:285-1790(+)
MGSSEALVIASDSAYADSSEPLLSKRIEEEGEFSSENYVPLSYNSGRRNFQDILFLLVFVLLVLATFAFGLFAVAHRNKSYGNLGSFVFNRNSSTCARYMLLESIPLVDGARVSDLLELGFHEGLTQFSLYSQLQEAGLKKHFVNDLTWTLVITLLLSIPIASTLLWILKSYTRQLVYACLPFFVLIPFIINVFWFVACIFNTECKNTITLASRIFIFLFIFVLCVIIAWIIISNWHRVELTISIVHTASEALSSNLGLLLVLPSLTIALLVYYVPIIVFLVFAQSNGKVVPNPKVAESGYVCGGSSGVQCCVWKQDSWVPAYFALAIITMLWSLTVMIEAQVYIISGTIGQWYFFQAETSPPGSLRNSVRNAFGPSFGTVCFSGIVFGLVRLVRTVVDNARDEAQEGFLYSCLRCCADFVFASIEFLNKFTVNFAAITGQGYCSSAKMSYELLKRNLLSTVVVETISTRILLGIIFVVTVVYAIVVCMLFFSFPSIADKV